MIRVRVIQLGILVGIVVALEIICALQLVRPSVLPAPHDVAIAIWTSLGDGILLANVGVTLARTFVGFASGLLVGIALGLGLWRLPRAASRSIEPLLASLYAVPWIAFYPALLVVFGLGDTPVVLVATVLAVVPIALNTFIGLSGNQRSWIAVARVANTSPWQRFFKVLLPGAAPHIMAGAKLGFIYAFLGIVGAEYLRSVIGLGYLVNTSYYFFQTTQMYAYVAVVLLIAAVITLSLTAAERKIGGRFR